MEECPEFVLRALRPGDAEAVAALIRAAFSAQSVATDPPPSAVRETAESVATWLAADGQRGVGVWAGDRLVACALWEVQARGLYVGRVSVDPGWRRRGLAPRLLGAAEAEARRRRLSRVLLSTRLVLTDNRRLFARYGFVETAEHAHPGYAHPTFVDMEKELGA